MGKKNQSKQFASKPKWYLSKSKYLMNAIKNIDNLRTLIMIQTEMRVYAV